MGLEVSHEFQQVKIKDLNDKNNMKMFTTSIRGEKALLQNRKFENLRPEF